MDDIKQLSLRWDKHAANLASEAECFFQDEAFLDCTLFAEGQCLQAHKLILSAASPYLATLLRTAPDKHPIVIFNDIKFEELKGIVYFIYNGAISMPEASVPAFLHAAQALLVRGLTHASTQWQSESIATKKFPHSVKRPVKPSSQPRFPNAGTAEEARPPPPYLPAPAEDASYRLQEIAMSNYPLQSNRRFSKPLTQHPNFVMSSWKLGSTVEDKNGHRKTSQDEPNDGPPAHMFKKFRLEKPPPATTAVEDSDKNVAEVEVKQEVEIERESTPPLVEPKVEVTEEEQDCNSVDSRELDEESPVPLLVCRTSLQDDSDGSLSGTNTSASPDQAHSEPSADLPCGRCNKRYKSRYALNRHTLYECGVARKSFACDECGKKVTRQDTLQKHKLIHLVQHMKDNEDGE